MPHARKQVRDAVVAVLTGLATTGANVFASRVHNVQESELPCLLVYALKDEAERVSIGSDREQERRLDFRVQGVDKATAALDDSLDQICLEVEKAMAADPTLGGLTVDLMLESTGINLNGDAEQPVGHANMDFTALYFVRETAPEVLV